MEGKNVIPPEVMESAQCLVRACRKHGFTLIGALFNLQPAGSMVISTAKDSPVAMLRAAADATEHMLSSGGCINIRLGKEN